ncbi:MAG TPA: L-threonylcarbamoyladenylate synthase [Candidatus Dormibacteraeota bacterium]|nr:L-threonylcarbamoyladenylate synthase [Candidatus Dormibacteraeota bacterium]
MRTIRLSANGEASIEHAAGIIRCGGLVAFPTETVYGLGANALDGTAAKKIFMAKDRPVWDPLIVHVHSREMLESVVPSLPARFDDLFSAFMPGPLTLVIRKSAAVPDVVTAGRETVAVRFPAHSVAQRLIAASNVPIAAPSANRFGCVSPTTADHVLADLDGRIEAVLDGGQCDIGVESTVLDLTATKPLILRHGAVTREQLQRVLGDVDVPDPGTLSPPQTGLLSPGMMPRHYAPRTKLLLSSWCESALASAVEERLEKKVGALVPTGWNISAAAKFDWGRWGDLVTLASRLYAGLRWLDEQKLDVIIAPLPGEEELGGAIRERLLKASGGAMCPPLGGRRG